MDHDRILQEAVLAEFAWEPCISAAHIGVTAKDGVVTLTGFVPNYLQKLAAERATGRVKGVKAIAEDLKVRLPDFSEHSDEDIARAALDRIAWEVAVPNSNITIKVEQGWVTLGGSGHGMGGAWHHGC